MDHCAFALAFAFAFALALSLTCGRSGGVVIWVAAAVGIARAGAGARLVGRPPEPFKGAPLDGPVVAGADAAPFDGDEGCCEGHSLLVVFAFVSHDGLLLCFFGAGVECACGCGAGEGELDS